MEGDHFGLGIHARAAFARTSEEDAYIPRIHLVKQLLFLLRSVIIVNEGYLILRYTLGYKLFLDVIVYIESLGRHFLYLRHLQIFKSAVIRDKYTVSVYRRFGYDSLHIIE